MSADAGSDGPGRAPQRLAGLPPIAFLQEVDGELVRWTVVEADARRVPGARGARCLVFACERCIRRVWDYPADWHTLDAPALAALSWRL